ncbi:hypothetical protein pb186bvf_019711 [Paramecium bursaria]
MNLDRAQQFTIIIIATYIFLINNSQCLNIHINIKFQNNMFLLLISSAIAQQCLHPKGAPGFTVQKYEGQWYEIAKFQTAGGAFFERDCVCTNLQVFYEDNDLIVNNICRKNTPDGKLTEAKGTLSDENPQNPGQFKESFSAFQSVDYTVAFLGERNGEEYSIEYDCSKNFLTGLQYCVHFLSRKPTMSTDLLNYLIAEVNKQNLNQLNLPLQYTNHTGCWNFYE